MDAELDQTIARLRGEELEMAGSARKRARAGSLTGRQHSERCPRCQGMRSSFFLTKRNDATFQ